jgi:apolipoprotein N-acyltransferase
VSFAVCIAGIWTVMEIIKGVFLTGFPWLSVGYAHVDGPFAMLAPWIGVYGLGGVAVLAAALLGAVIHTLLGRGHNADINQAAVIAPTIIIGVVIAGAIGFSRQPVFATPDGEPIPVRLVQGNVSQSMKFNRDTALKAIQDYVDITTQGAARLTLIPETAWVVPLSMTPRPVLSKLVSHLNQHNAYFSVGLPARTAAGLTNSVMTIDSTTRPDAVSAVNLYSKRHLVPFGEFVPLGFQWFVDMMHIPLGNFSRGTDDQAQLQIDGRQIAFNICYEDLFGEELAVQVRNGAGVLANVSNLAWFGDSHALSQHLNIARMRSLELHRPMIRSTNTGVTAHIGADGKVLSRLPANQQLALDVQVQPMTGLTPYARYGLQLPLALGVLLLILGLTTGRIRRPTSS